MKKILLRSFFIMLPVLYINICFGQANSIVGLWLTEEGESKVEIFKNSKGKYCGKIIWLEEPNENGKPKVDDDNPDPKLRDRPIMGLQILNDFVYDSDDEEWEDGTIYDPKNGSTYDCYIWFDEGNKKILKVRGYIGFSFIGRSTTWTKAN